jgi:hypothetical protein
VEFKTTAYIQNEDKRNINVGRWGEGILDTWKKGEETKRPEGSGANTVT